mmetsp:Transcript_15192/g.25016  ORF Transcript_15192/g.25016 Transcript_15192/m.25016 type:complete len:1019 (-) Transcript_15192:522-3578(-)
MCTLQVAAEALLDASTEPFLGLHYPDTDIPQRARELFCLNRIRLIHDALEVPAVLTPALIDGSLVDLSLSSLRAPSICHAQYLKHMGVRSSCSNAILHGNRLWGLFICYHSSPRYLDYHQRASLKLLSHACGVLLATKLQQEYHSYEENWEAVKAKLYNIMVNFDDVMQGLLQLTPSLVELIPSGGVAIVTNEVIRSVGVCPSPEALRSLKDWLDKNVVTSDVWMTDQLSALNAEAKAYPEIASGVLFFTISRGRHGYVMWFRPEWVFHIAWGGNYEDAIQLQYDANGYVTGLGPRCDFTQHRREVRERSKCWTPSDIAAARTLRQTIMDVMVSKAADLKLRSEVLSSLNNRLEASNGDLTRFANELQQLIRTVPVPIIEVNENGLIIEWNPMAEKATGFSKEQMLGKSFVDTVVACEHRGSVKAMFTRCIQSICNEPRLKLEGDQRTSPIIEVHIFGKDQGRVEWALHAAARIDNKKRSVVIVGQDITERKEMIRAQVRATQAAAANDAKSRFLATMSHEMRTPLNGLLGMLQLALDCEMSKACSDYIQKAYSSGEHLLTIISDCLDLSLIEAGKMDLKEIVFDVQAIIRSVVTLISPRAESKNLRLVVDMGPNFPSRVWGDPDRFRQVLTNFATNAVKYSDGGTVTFVCRATEMSKPPTLLPATAIQRPSSPRPQTVLCTTSQLPVPSAKGPSSLDVSPRGASVVNGTSMTALTVQSPTEPAAESPPLTWMHFRIEVKDQGRGIRETDIPLLFNMFSRVQQGCHVDPGGIGLGLHICKNLVQFMGGEISCSSTFGEGSSFCFEVPLKIDQHAAVQGQDNNNPLGGILPFSPSASLGGVQAPHDCGKLLLVDDTAVNLQVARIMLQKSGYTVDTAVNGLEAVEKFSESATKWKGAKSDDAKPLLYAVILMDCEMPKMNGYEAVMAIRQMEATESIPRTPIVALTAHAMKEHAQKCIDVGMDDYLTKPIRSADLLGTVHRFITTNRRPRASTSHDVIGNHDSMEPTPRKLSTCSTQSA